MINTSSILGPSARSRRYVVPAAAPRVVPRPLACFWTYDPHSPSFRHRLAPVIEGLCHNGWRCRVERFPRGRYGWRVLERRLQVAEADLLVLGKIVLGLGETALLRGSTPPVVFDVDDAIFVRQARRLGAAPDAGPLRRRKFDLTCGLADLVTAGNRHLAHVALRSARHVEVVATSVEVAGRIDAPASPRTLVWIGRPENLRYLELVRRPLAALRHRYPDLRLRVICSHFPDWTEVPIERIRWSPQSEARHVASASIGIMPLDDDAWTRGKCGFKLLQCMAQGLPTIASPVGVNCEIISHGVDGFLATDGASWTMALRTLLDHPVQARIMGDQARDRVRLEYDRTKTVGRQVRLLENLVGGVRRSGHALETLVHREAQV